MSSNRREFLQQAGVVAGVEVSAFQLAAQQRAPTMPTASASALMATFGLRYPIFCAGMGTVATPELAIAVSNGGGLGAIGTGSRGARAADLVRERVSRTKSGTSRPFAVNFLLAFDPATLPLALELGAPIIQFAWGIPSAENVAAIRKARAKMGIQISSVAGARRALDVGPDYLICQGTEAGGRGRDRKRRAHPPSPAGRGVRRVNRYSLCRDQGGRSARRLQGRHHSGQSRRHGADRLLSKRMGKRAASYVA